VGCGVKGAAQFGWNEKKMKESINDKIYIIQPT
jgi:hypothetical protein